jgi:ABC-type antimicrobial peptide transport system permease subunit
MGRDISWSDFGSTVRTAVVNEAFARQYLDGRLPIGRRFCLGRGYDPAESFEIVGLARDAKFDSIRREVPPTAYISFTSGTPKVRPMTVAVRTFGDPLSLIGAVRDALRAADPQLSMMRIRTQTAQIDEMMLQERMFARISTLIGSLVLLLAAIGLYGTLSFAVARRTNEIGIRMAIGASGARVLWMVLRESLCVAAAGLLIGLPAALALGRLIASYLYGVEPHDPPALIGAAVLLAAVCAAAGFLPARRAARVDPIRALHCE